MIMITKISMTAGMEGYSQLLLISRLACRLANVSAPIGPLCFHCCAACHLTDGKIVALKFPGLKR